MYKKIAISVIMLSFLTACSVPVTTEQYTPVVDISASKNVNNYNNDLNECRSIALQKESEYQDRQNKEMAGRLIGGLILGAVVGQAVGGNSNWTAYGAANGAAAGVASTDTELAQGGPKRIIDRCMAGRGYSVLNDPGKA